MTAVASRRERFAVCYGCGGVGMAHRGGDGYLSAFVSQAHRSAWDEMGARGGWFAPCPECVACPDCGPSSDERCDPGVRLRKEEE